LLRVLDSGLVVATIGLLLTGDITRSLATYRYGRGVFDWIIYLYL